MRIAVVTYHRAYNCGAMLQAWAFKTFLQRLGHQVEFPVCNHVGETVRWLMPWTKPETQGLRWVRSFLGRTVINLFSIPNEDILRYRYAAFRRKNLPERTCPLSELGVHYDLLIVGSDQVWSEDLSESFAPVFFGENLPRDVRRIAYAASYGDRPLAGEKIWRVVRALDNFSAVSVREKLAKDQLSAITGKDIKETVDPTLLLDASDYDKIARGAVPAEPYLFMYTLSTSYFFVNTARELSKRLGVKCVIAPCYQYSRYGAPKGLSYCISPDRLVQFARNAKYILAGSFHGTVMGVLFNKPFLSLRSQTELFESRPAALLRKLGCQDRIVNPSMPIDVMFKRLITPLPDLKEKIVEMRSESIEWLRKAMRG